MTELRIATIRAIHDAMALRGLEDGGGGVIRTSDPQIYMSESRLRLAREAARHLPTGATVLDADRIADHIEPMIRAMLTPDGTADV